MKMDGVKHDSQHREDLISEFIRHCSDLVPYNDPDYERTLLKMAEEYADNVMDPNSEFNVKLRELNQSMDDELIEIPF